MVRNEKVLPMYRIRYVSVYSRVLSPHERSPADVCFSPSSLGASWGRGSRDYLSKETAGRVETWTTGRRGINSFSLVISNGSYLIMLTGKWLSYEMHLCFLMI
jgi:hypothetical protein